MAWRRGAAVSPAAARRGRQIRWGTPPAHMPGDALSADASNSARAPQLTTLQPAPGRQSSNSAMHHVKGGLNQAAAAGDGVQQVFTAPQPLKGAVTRSSTHSLCAGGALETRCTHARPLRMSLRRWHCPVSQEMLVHHSSHAARQLARCLRPKQPCYRYCRQQLSSSTQTSSQQKRRDADGVASRHSDGPI